MEASFSHIYKSPPGFVLHARARHHHWSGQGLLSVKSFRSGQALYRVGRGLHRVDTEHLLVLNHQQEYQILVEAENLAESFCVFFLPGFVESVWYGLKTPVETLLEQPEATPSVNIEFPTHTHPHHSSLSITLSNLDKDNLEEGFYGLALGLLRLYTSIQQNTAQIAAARASTRAELYRRLHRARDFMEASLEQPLSLVQIAAVANLSPNHLLRSFRALFGQSPRQYLISRRLERARYWLIHSAKPIGEICMEVGFESLGSFSWLFRKRFGLSPSEYRYLNHS